MTMFSSCCNNSSETDVDDALESCCSFYAFFYVVGGLLGLVSVVLVVAKFDSSDLGWSFFLMVAAIAIVILQVILQLTYSVYSRRSTEKCSVFFVYRRKIYYDVI
uniref:Uncharacterized protein LOC111104215 n=1 Tax=Crassostrea virginica TaxID=6565 RepID=A0A8B8AQK2_CRAVI|nr:uncharacterized protein LOC111104215 [Crassostrea virginica]